MASSEKLVFETIQIDTFTGDRHSGSPQFLYVFDSLDDFIQADKTFTCDNEYDCSLVFIENTNSVHVRWKNTFGPIQFCGSAAYALSWWLFNQRPFEGSITLKSPSLTLKAFQDSGTVYLMCPRFANYELKPGPRGEECYFYRDSGVQLIQLGSLAELREFNGTPQNLASVCGKRQDLVSAVGIFYWSKSEGEGYLRYFTPRHGRNEDYVTGSVHSYLSPVIAESFGATLQKWTQLSKNGGRVYTCLTDSGVMLHGHCRMRGETHKRVSI